MWHLNHVTTHQGLQEGKYHVEPWSVWGEEEGKKVNLG